MSRNALRLADYLAHILEAIERIERYTRGLDRAAFLGTEIVQDAVIRNFEIIGEASRNIAQRHPDFLHQHPEIALADAYRLRNAVVHGYFTVDLGIVWQTTLMELPRMKSFVQTEVQKLAES